MRKKTATEEQSRSLKTFFLYTALVVIVIIISLTMKVVSIVQNSKYDGEHQFILALGQNEKVEEIIAFRPNTSVSLLEIKDSSVPLASVGKTLGIPVDGKINVGSNMSLDTSITDVMSAIAWRYNAIESDVTIYDIIRFVWLSKSFSPTNQITEKITLPQEERKINETVKSLFTDQNISAENITIQIINASDTPGMGKRLERILVNMGANVVAVSTLYKKEETSTIQYFEEETYTLRKLESLLGYPVSKLPKETVANIVVTIGEDSKDTTEF